MNKLPSKDDFEAYDGWLDQVHAWESFGGLTVEDAYIKFCENPGYYQEDFMWMGAKAFDFYFPVLEKYLSEAKPEYDADDCGAWIIGCSVEKQLEEVYSNDLKKRIQILKETVIQKFTELRIDDETKTRVLDQWKKINAS